MPLLADHHRLRCTSICIYIHISSSIRSGQSVCCRVASESLSTMPSVSAGRADEPALRCGGWERGPSACAHRVQGPRRGQRQGVWGVRGRVSGCRKRHMCARWSQGRCSISKMGDPLHESLDFSIFYSFYLNLIQGFSLFSPFSPCLSLMGCCYLVCALL